MMTSSNFSTNHLTENTMKRAYLLFALAALASAASCQKEMTNTQIEKGQPFTFKAVRSVESKTVLEGEKSVYWAPGDKVAVYDAEGKAVEFSTDIKTNSATAVFTAPSIVLPENGVIASAYPYNGTSTYESGLVKGLNVPARQTAKAGSFDPNAAVTVAVGKVDGENTELSYTSVHSLISFTLDAECEVPASVKLSCGGNLAGTANYDEEGNVTVTSGTNEVVLEGNFEAGETYYIVVWPGAAANGLTLTLGETEVSTEKTVTLVANKIYNFGTVGKPEEGDQMSEGYAAWLGNWKFTGANNASFDVTFSVGEINSTYLMSGWEGFQEGEGVDIIVDWMEDQGIWVIFSQTFGEFNFGSDGMAEIGLYPFDAENYFYPYIDLPILLGGFDSEGNRIGIGYSEETSQGTISFTQMRYLAEFPDGYYGLSKETIPTFPLTITALPKLNKTYSSTGSIKNQNSGLKVYSKLTDPYKTK